MLNAECGMLNGPGVWREQVGGHREGVAAVPAGVVGDEAAGAGGEEEQDGEKHAAYPATFFLR